jgi:hydroxyacylglutathione hydrolase
MSSDKLPEISPDNLSKTLSSYKLIDVRRPDEFVGELGHIEGASLATLETSLESHLTKLPKDASYVFVCKSGGRSSVATKLALSMGFKNVFNMTGGMLGWNQAGLQVKK